jgi:hypothetical protein
MARHPKGYVLWRGLSPINHQPIVAVLTITSANRKTGDMAQVWILNESSDPVQSIATGEDVSICGNCLHRKQPDGTRTCYVNVGQAPLSVYRSWKRGTYPHVATVSDDTLQTKLKTRKIRWGAYGDPAVLPASLVHWINGFACGHTGYTHQWRQPWAQWTRGVFQASCDGLLDYLEASDNGWRTFTVVKKGYQPDYAKQCPATVEHSTAQCITCGLCNGAKSDIFVNAHGPSAKHVTYA